MLVVMDMDLVRDTWSGGNDNAVEFDRYGDLEIVEGYLCDMFSDHTPTATEVNDALWFNSDYLAQYLGYKDMDDYITKHEDCTLYVPLSR